jgi:hypothetical protein
MKNRRRIVQFCLILALIAFSAVLFVIGKGHQILIDNKRITVDGQRIDGYEWAYVYMNGAKKPIEVEEDFREQAKVSGPWHSIKVEILENEKVVKTVERKFTLSLADSFILNLQLMVEEKEGWLKER